MRLFARGGLRAAKASPALLAMFLFPLFARLNGWCVMITPRPSGLNRTGTQVLMLTDSRPGAMIAAGGPIDLASVPLWRNW